MQAYLQHRAILYGKLRVPSVQGGVHGKTDVNISPETMLDVSLTLLMLGENQKLENTSTCKNLYRYNSQRPLAGVLLDNVKRMVYPSFKREQLAQLCVSVGVSTGRLAPLRIEMARLLYQCEGIDAKGLAFFASAESRHST